MNISAVQSIRVMGYLIMLNVIPAAVEAAAIKDLSGLIAVRAYEISFSTVASDFGATDTRLVQQITGTLDESNRDFGFHPNEHYDIFYSDADGALNDKGAFITIEGTCTAALSCFNINGVSLVFSGDEHFANSVASVVFGNAPNSPGSDSLATDGDLGTFTRLGDTTGLSAAARMRLTVGFAETTPVPLPAALPMFAVALGAISIWRRCAAQSHCLSDGRGAAL